MPAASDQPTAPVLSHHPDGTVTVRHAAPVIELPPTLLKHPPGAPWLDERTGVLYLDTAGRHRYRLLGTQTCIMGEDMLICRRMRRER
jgi:hypothetical protein